MGKTYFAVMVPMPLLKQLVIQDGAHAAAMATEHESTDRRYRTIYRVGPTSNM